MEYASTTIRKKQATEERSKGLLNDTKVYIYQNTNFLIYYKVPGRELTKEIQWEYCYKLLKKLKKHPKQGLNAGAATRDWFMFGIPIRQKRFLTSKLYLPAS